MSGSGDVAVGRLGGVGGAYYTRRNPYPRSRPEEGSAVANQLHVELVAVEEKVWTGEAEMVVARTTEGELAVLPGHAPMLGQLAEPGEVRVRRDGGETLAWEVAGGFLSVTANGVTILAESAAPATPESTH